MSRLRIAGLLLFLITLVVYLPVLQNGFINYDDTDYVTENPVVRQGLTWPGCRWAFTMWHASNWHPLTWLSHMADCEVFRLNPAGHHLVNVILHAVNAVLLFILFRRLTASLWPAAFVAALFAWHPMHVESVAWVSERKDVLSTFFALLALLAYVRHAQSQNAIPEVGDAPAKTGGFHLSRPYWLAWFLFACSLMSKPMLVTLPCVMLLLDFWPLQRRRGFAGLCVEKLPFLVLSAASCIVTVFAQRQEAMATFAKCPPGLRLENVVVAYAGYLQKCFWPVKLAVFYPLPDAIAWSAVVVAGAMLIAITAMVVFMMRQRPYLLVGWLWYLGTLVPVIGLVQVGDQSMADRYSYFPLIGIFLAVTFLIKDVTGKLQLSKAVIIAPVIVVLGACLMLTTMQLSYWRSSETLFTHALAVTKNNALAHLNLGEALQEQQRPAEALAQYEEVLKLSPARQEAYNNIARILSDEGRPEAALEYSRTAVRLNPRSPSLHTSLGIVLAELKQFDGAQAEFSEALRLDADNVPAHFMAGRTYLKQGNDLAALPQLRAALRLAPDDFQLVIFTARVLASDENPQVRDAAGALALAEQAGKIAGNAQPLVLDTLAMALAEGGRFGEAVKAEQQAVALAQPAGANGDAAAMQQRLEAYQGQKAWRESFAK
ncbi:MAG TPA: tetratricopeptide repeat protein [Candidatus Acidoferrales bacterium]|jgi:tetratricopeptide (TPR) repeat protein|nr:tetratricopeptide repeat protein [Candidatus Acidoferrales bacterium]